MMIVAEKRYTVKEFIELEELDNHPLYELINGEIVKRSSLTPQHQIILGRLVRIVDTFVLNKKLGTVLFAPVDVCLNNENLLIPDMVYIANKKQHIITENGIEGIPDLVVEILSPSTAKYDRGEKMKTYKRNRVAEYWIIDPKAQSIEVYSLQNEDYDLLSYAVEMGNIESKVLADLELSVQSLFGGE